MRRSSAWPRSPGARWTSRATAASPATCCTPPPTRPARGTTSASRPPPASPAACRRSSNGWRRARRPSVRWPWRAPREARPPLRSFVRLVCIQSSLDAHAAMGACPRSSEEGVLAVSHEPRTGRATRKLALSALLLVIAVVVAAVSIAQSPARSHATETRASHAANRMSDGAGRFERYNRPSPELPAVPAGAVKRFRVDVLMHETKVADDKPAPARLVLRRERPLHARHRRLTPDRRQRRR